MPDTSVGNSLDHQAQELLVYLEHIVRRLVATRRDSTAFESLSRQELAVLDLLGTHGPLLVNNLAERAGLPLSTVAAAARKLVGKRLARRHVMAADRRLVQLDLTAGGVAFHRASLAARTDVARHILAALDIEERSRLLRLLRTVVTSRRSRFVSHPSVDRQPSDVTPADRTGS